MPFKAYAASVRGASHEDAGEVCQDSARVYFSNGFAIAAVSDGHGSEKHFRSASGSEMATRIAIRSVCDFEERNGGLDALFESSPQNTARRIAANIICGWNSEIAAHLRFAPLNERERAVSEKYGGLEKEIMYGATLIVAVMTEKGCFGLQIGDGSFAAFDGKDMVFPVPEDKKLVGNLTTSLCDNDAISSFRHFYRKGGFPGIMLSSDGLINSFLSVDSFFSFGKRVLAAVSDKNTEFLSEHLKTRSRGGSRDDISIAAIVRS